MDRWTGCRDKVAIFAARRGVVAEPQPAQWTNPL